MKKLTVLIAVMALVLLCGGMAQAEDINFGGAVKIKQGGTTGSPAVNFTFSGLKITTGTLGGDPLEGTDVSITPDSMFSFTSISGDVGLFSPNSGTLTMGNAVLGTLIGDIDFVLISNGGVNGSFSVQVALSNVVITPGTGPGASSILANLVGATSGEGALTFQFTAPSGTTLTDLLNMGLSGKLSRRSEINTSVSGSVAVPEPASLALLGTGLMLGGSFVRRKLLGA
ncbi:MAG TPA: PEP-CTERM sorting domain-containing protein [Terriglobales bacterium]|nr:PEP-CTERM sorting domain-containing protein [Terriglobales bacterium]